MGTAILRKAGSGALWLFDAGADTLSDITPADLRSGGGSFTYSGDSENDQGEQVIIVDWAGTADYTHSAAGNAEAVGHQVYSLLMGGAPGADNPRSGDSRAHERAFAGPDNPRPLHFIGHSFGTVVNSEAIRRLGALQGVAVGQMTTLDPHDWDQACLGVDGSVLLPDVQIWNNVALADNYFNTKGGNSCDNPYGRAITGSLKGAGKAGGVDLSDLHGFHDGHLSDPHSRVHAFYHGTIDTNSRGKDVDGIGIETAWYANGFEQAGYGYSRLGGSKNLSDFSSACRVDPASPSAPPGCQSDKRNRDYEGPDAGMGDIYVDYRPKHFFNGDFSATQLTSDGRTMVIWKTPQDVFPGFRKTPVLELVQVGSSVESVAKLTGTEHERIESHLTFVPALGDATALEFQLRTNAVSGSDGDTLTVYFDDQQLGEPIPLNGATDDFQLVLRDISRFRGRSGIFGFRLSRSGEGASEVYIDKIEVAPLLMGPPIA